MLQQHRPAGVGDDDDVAAVMAELGRRAAAAARVLSTAAPETKRAALLAAADAIDASRDTILEANALDMATAQAAGLTAAFLDRLRLTGDRIAEMAGGLRAIADLPDPVGTVIAEWDRPNGLHIERVRTPLGVIGVIFESRPNVTADAGGLCLKAGNAVILRGGSDSGIPPARFTPACFAVSRRPACPRHRSRSCRRPTAPPSARC